jgi:hypothetical protein
MMVTRRRQTISDREGAEVVVLDDGLASGRYRVAGEIDKLKRLTVQVETFVDKQLAHPRPQALQRTGDLQRPRRRRRNSRRGSLQVPLFADRKGYSTLKATVQFDWKEVFRVALQKPPA